MIHMHDFVSFIPIQTNLTSYDFPCSFCCSCLSYKTGPIFQPWYAPRSVVHGHPRIWFYHNWITDNNVSDMTVVVWFIYLDWLCPWRRKRFVGLHEKDCFYYSYKRDFTPSSSVSSTCPQQQFAETVTARHTDETANSAWWIFRFHPFRRNRMTSLSLKLNIN